MSEFLFEFLFDLIFEGSIGLSSNKKISKWIRYPLILIIFLFFLAFFLLILFVALSIYSETKIGAVAFIFLDIFMLVMGIKKFKALYIIRK